MCEENLPVYRQILQNLQVDQQILRNANRQILDKVPVDQEIIYRHILKERPLMPS